MKETTTLNAFEAFLKAQSEFGTAIKDAKNPFFKSNYADMSSVWEACGEALHRNGFFVMQPIRMNEFGLYLETLIVYRDGTVIEKSNCPIKTTKENDPQALGSAITYIRRYSLASLLGIITDDDDGNAGAGNNTQKSITSLPQQQKTNPISAAMNLGDWGTKIDDLKDDFDVNFLLDEVKKQFTGKSDGLQIKTALNIKAKSLGLMYDTEKAQYEYVNQPV